LRMGAFRASEVGVGGQKKIASPPEYS
jgi:hypothetical protein